MWFCDSVYDNIRILGMQLPRRNSVAMEYSLAFEQTDGMYFYVSASQLYTPKKEGDTKIPLLLYVCRLF